jgi:hypothetical protein
MKKKWLAIFLTIISCQSNADIYRAKHEKFINLVSPKIYSLFLAHGVCSDRNECQKKGLYFFGSGKEELHISLYSMTDLKVIQDIIGCVLSTYEENNLSPSVKLHFFREAHSSGIKFFNKDKPFLAMSIEEKK